MKLRQVAELAALAAANATPLVVGGHDLPKEPVEDFWKLSRRQLHRWSQTLRQSCEAATSGDPAARANGRRATDSLLRRIFVAEVPIRVWAGILAATDRHRGGSRVERLARSVLGSQLVLRREALQAMLAESMSLVADVQDVDRLRRRTECWIDLLLGQLTVADGLDEFAVDPQRSREFGEEQIADSDREATVGGWDLVLAGMRRAIPREEPMPADEAEFHRALIRAVLTTYPADVLSDQGPYRALVTARLRRELEGLTPSGLRSHRNDLRKVRSDAAHRPRGIRFAELWRSVGED